MLVRPKNTNNVASIKAHCNFLLPKGCVHCLKLEHKGNYILKNVHILWISMLSPIKMLMEENTFLMKMAYDVFVKAKVTSNLELLSNLNVIFNLPCISFSLEVVQSLIKLNKLHDVFMYGFVSVMKIC